MDNNLKRSIILDHYQNPHNKGLIEDDTYIKTNMNNESCIDELNIIFHFYHEMDRPVQTGLICRARL